MSTGELRSDLKRSRLENLNQEINKKKKLDKTGIYIFFLIIIFKKILIRNKKSYKI
jgi:hypothetical protein